MKIIKNHQTNKHIYTKIRSIEICQAAFLKSTTSTFIKKLFLRQFKEAPILWPTKPY